VAYIVVRSLLLSTLEGPEPRYTLECFPMVIAFAAAAFASLTGRQFPHPARPAGWLDVA